MSKSLSILIPAYNSAKTIERCIESVVNIDDCEILVWDDGSKDDTLNILKKMCVKYDNLNIFSSENAGVSQTRNKLIEASKGEFLMFLDSDDYYEVNMNQYIEDFVRLDYDYVRFTRTKINKDGIKTTENIKNFNYLNSNQIKDNYLKLYDNSAVKNVQTGLYKKKIVDDNNIKFNTQITYGEDTCFSIEYLAKCNNFLMTNLPIYIYDKTNETSLTSKYNDKMMSSLTSIMDLELKYFGNKKVNTGIILRKYRRLISLLKEKIKMYPDTSPLKESSYIIFVKNYKKMVEISKIRTLSDLILYTSLKSNSKILIKTLTSISGGY